LDEIEPEVYFIDLFFNFYAKFDLELDDFLEMIIRVFDKIENVPGNIKNMIIFKAIYDTLKYMHKTSIVPHITGIDKIFD
jgi:hypothetical protein